MTAIGFSHSNNGQLAVDYEVHAMGASYVSQYSRRKGLPNPAARGPFAARRAKRASAPPTTERHSGGKPQITTSPTAAELSEMTVFNYSPTKEDLVFGRMVFFDERLAA